jgi:hypothetical protein
LRCGRLGLGARGGRGHGVRASGAKLRLFRQGAAAARAQADQRSAALLTILGAQAAVVVTVRALHRVTCAGVSLGLPAEGLECRFGIGTMCCDRQLDRPSVARGRQLRPRASDCLNERRTGRVRMRSQAFLLPVRRVGTPSPLAGEGRGEGFRALPVLRKNCIRRSPPRRDQPI